MSRRATPHAARPTATRRQGANYLHCTRCMFELPRGKSPALWARLSVGVLPDGLQVWCERHDTEVVRIDFARLDAWRDAVEEQAAICREFTQQSSNEPTN